METIAPLREPVDGYCGTLYRVATLKASAPELSGIRSRETRSLLSVSSTDSLPDHPPIEDQQTEPAVPPTLPAPDVPSGPAVPYGPHNGPAAHCRGGFRL